MTFEERQARARQLAEIHDRMWYLMSGSTATGPDRPRVLHDSALPLPANMSIDWIAFPRTRERRRRWHRLAWLMER